MTSKIIVDHLMSTTKRIQRIELLIDRLEEGKAVSRSSIQRVLGENALKDLDLWWQKEQQNRLLKPKEIVEYSKHIKRGLIYYSLGEKLSLRGDSYNSGKYFRKAESILEGAVESLCEVVFANPDLRMWIDRDVGFGIEVEYCPAGIPRPVWSNSNYKQRDYFPKVSRKDIARQMLQTELEKLVGGEMLKITKFENRKKRFVDISSFSGFKF